ncbi:MAG: Crp/Fnr family transcriptional regulator [Rhodospirillales bacterium]|nr:Crp/Fnr family transcriptional regulator [Rhodospirillales bacterium]
MENETTLENIPALSGLNTEERQDLSALCQVRSFSSQQDVYGQDELPTAVYFVLSGQVRLKTFSEGGQEIFFGIIGPGDIFGDKSAIDGQPHENSAVTLTESKLAILPRVDFLNFIDNTPKFGRMIAENLCVKISRSHSRIMDLGTIAANNRVHAEILRLARLAPVQTHDEVIISPSPQHADISHQVCAARETVSRAFGEMVKLGITEKIKGD